MAEPLIGKVKGERFDADGTLPKLDGLPTPPDDVGPPGKVVPKIVPPPPGLPDAPATPGAPAATLPGRLLKLHSLKCDETEDWSSDEALLDVFVDNLPVSLPIGRKKEMDEGDNWALNGVVPFLREVRIELHEEDWPDANDHLGTVTIGEGPVRAAQAKFTLDDADYTLFYDVLEPKELAGDDLATLKRFLQIP